VFAAEKKKERGRRVRHPCEAVGEKKKRFWSKLRHLVPSAAPREKKREKKKRKE